MLYPHGKGRYQKEAKHLFESLVPNSGQAKTVQGELIRCMTRLASESYRNGNGNWDRGFGDMARFVGKQLCDGTFTEKSEATIKKDVAAVISSGRDPENGAYVHEKNDAYTRLTDRVVEWCQKHPDPIKHVKNPKLKR